jgi:hypothetical protein
MKLEAWTSDTRAKVNNIQTHNCHDSNEEAWIILFACEYERMMMCFEGNVSRMSFVRDVRTKGGGG